MIDLETKAANAERSVIGGLLCEPDRFSEIKLVAEDFTTPEYRMLFESMRTTAESGGAVDVVTVLGNMPTERVREFATDAYTIVLSTHARNLSAYCDIVKMASMARKAKRIAEQLTRFVDDNGQSAVESAVADLLELVSTERRYEFSLRDALSVAVEQIDIAHQRGGEIELPTGLVDLDRALGGWHRSDLVVIGARPAMGKTALILNFLDRCGVSCGIVSAEQPHEQIGGRLLSMSSGVSFERMRQGATLTDEDFRRLFAGASACADRSVRVYDKPAPTLAEVVGQARAWKVRHGIKILFVDYLQRIRVGSDRQAQHERVGEVAMGLKNLARDLGICVVALAQVGRQVESRNDKRPGMGDLSGSSEIEKEADQIITLYRDEVYDEDSADKGIAELIVCKNRHGRIGTVRVVWRPECMRFENYADAAA